MKGILRCFDCGAVGTSFPRPAVDLTRKSMRVGIILFENDPKRDSPAHFVSRSMADSICRERVRLVVKGVVSFLYVAVPISKKLIHLRVSESFANIKARHKVGKACVKPMPRLLPPSQPINLDLAYPEANRESGRHPHQAFLDECKIARALQESAAS